MKICIQRTENQRLPCAVLGRVRRESCCLGENVLAGWTQRGGRSPPAWHPQRLNTPFHASQTLHCLHFYVPLPVGRHMRVRGMGRK